MLKGPSIARWLYDEGESRPYGDVDLVVSPSRFGDAEVIAGGLGFRHIKLGDQLDEASRHRSWFREQDGVCIELHRNFTGINVTDQQFWDELATKTDVLPLGVLEVSAEVPGVPARALLIGLHAAAHGPVGTPLADLERALRRLPDSVWNDAAELARRLRAEPTFAVGLSLVPVGAALACRLNLDLEASTETLLNASAPPPTAGGWERFARAPGVRGKLRFALAKLAPPPDFMRVVDPISRRGGAWLAIGYAVRPFRLAIQAPRGFRAWRSVHRRRSL